MSSRDSFVSSLISLKRDKKRLNIDLGLVERYKPTNSRVYNQSDSIRILQFEINLTYKKAIKGL